MGAVASMESVMYRVFIHQWQRKLMAVLLAAFIWLSMSQSIITTKTIPSVPVRIINLPAGKTVEGLLPNGFLSKRMTLTLSGTKEIVENLEPGDFEVVLDATDHMHDWLVHITKKNLVSLNPEVDLTHHITQVSHIEFPLKIVPERDKEETP